MASPSPSPSPLPSPTPARAQPQIEEIPFAAVVDNIVDARPHVGLSAADVVYEAPAEGGIPRLLPIYLRGGAERIGPVRSARHYFALMAAEYGAALTHIGASPQGFAMMDHLGTPRVDESRGDDGFVRDRRRAAPHNAFVNADAVRQNLLSRGLELKGSWGGLFFGSFQPGEEPATRLQIDYPGGEHYVVSYEYDPESRLYFRAMDGSPHLDGATGDHYAARSILVQYVPVEPIPNDNAGRLDVQLVGKGEAILIAEGTRADLEWSRVSEFQPTHFRRQDGAPFSLPEGQVWIQVVPLETRVSVGD